MLAAQNWSGIFLVNKPQGMTSFGVVARIRKLTGMRRVGHIGTLDPFADGLLPVCTGKATSAVQFMEKYDKTYQVRIVFGQATDTQDLTGKVIETHQLTDSERSRLAETDFAELRQAVTDLIGCHEQVPPMYSAIKKNGRPLYAYARAGEIVDRKARPVTIRRAEILDISLGQQMQMDLLVECSKGTYIRTIADDLGRKLGYFAYAAQLTRTRCGPFLLTGSASPDLLFQLRSQIELDFSRQKVDQDEQNSLNRDDIDKVFRQKLIEKGWYTSSAAAFTGWPDIIVSQEEALRLVYGQVVELASERIADDSADKYAVYCLGQLVAVSRLKPLAGDGYTLKTERVFLDRADF